MPRAVPRPLSPAQPLPDQRRKDSGEHPRHAVFHRVACYKPYSSSVPKTPKRTLDAGCVGCWAGRTPGGWRARSLGCRIKHPLPLETFPLPSGMCELPLYARPGSRKEDRAAEGSVTSFLPWPLSTDKQKPCAAFPNSVPAPAGASQLEL